MGKITHIPLKDFKLSGLVLESGGLCLEKKTAFKEEPLLRLEGVIDAFMLPCRRLLVLRAEGLSVLSLPEAEELPLPGASFFRGARTICADERAFYLLEDRTIRCLCRDTYQLRWQAPLRARAHQAFIWRTRLFVFSLEEEKLLSYRLEDGAFLKEESVPGLRSLTVGEEKILLKEGKIWIADRAYPLLTPPGDSPKLLGLKDEIYLLKGQELFRLKAQAQYCSGMASKVFQARELAGKIIFVRGRVAPKGLRLEYELFDEMGKGFKKTSVLGPCLPIPEGIKGRLELRLYLDPIEASSSQIKEILLIPSAAEWLEYLPAIYGEDPETYQFLKDLLGPFKVIYSQFLKTIESWPERLSPDTDEPEILFYLAGLLNISPESPEDIQRALTLVPRLYPLRGTRTAIEETLAKMVPERAFLIEAFQWLEVSQEDFEAPNWVELFGREMASFVVLVDHRVSHEEFETLQSLIRDWSPLAVKAKIYHLRPSLLLGQPLILGLNTILASEGPVIGKSALGLTGGLEDREPGGRLEERAWLGLDSYLS
ncbi:hypothetical protein [Thermosulfuriphilus sp.]